MQDEKEDTERERNREREREREREGGWKEGVTGGRFLLDCHVAPASDRGVTA